MSVNTNNVVEKVKNVALEVAVPTEIVALPVSEKSDAVVLTVAAGDVQAYGQLVLLTKSAKNIKFVGGSKAGMLLVPSSIENDVLIKQYINPSFDAAMLVAHVTYGDYEKLRISVKNMGGGTAKKSEKASFYDRDLSGVIELEGNQYIFGEGKITEEISFSKYNNTMIVRLVKNIFDDHRLYSDEDKSGFHKFISRMPKDELVRTSDNYAYYIKWSEIVAKIDAFNANAANTEATNKLSGAETVERIKDIIAAVYPGVEIATDKDLVLECLKSAFAEISRGKFVFEDGKIVSKLELLAAEKQRKKLEKEAEKAEKEKKKQADKAAKLVSDAAAAPVAPVLGAAVAPVLGASVAPASVTPVAPASVAPASVAPASVTPVAPVAPVAPASVAPASVTPVSVAPVIGNPSVKM